MTTWATPEVLQYSCENNDPASTGERPVVCVSKSDTESRHDLAHVLHPAGSRFQDLHAYIESNVARGRRPTAFRLEDWIRVHVVDFFNALQDVWSTMSAHTMCTSATCRDMSAGPCYTYLWADGETVVTPLHVSAPEYVKYLVEWITAQMHNPDVFALDHHRDNGSLDNTATSSFMHVAKTMLKRMFRVYAHIYHSHLDDFILHGAEPLLNAAFKRFIHFVLEFDLIDPKELNALRRLISNFVDEANLHKGMPASKDSLRSSDI